MKLQKNKSQYNHKSSLGLKERLEILPIIVTLCLIPFIVRYKEYNPNLKEYSWFGYSETYVDLFLYYKQVAFIFISFLALVLLIYKVAINKKIIFTKSYYLLLAYNVLLIVSTILSPYRHWGFYGIFEQFESVFVHIGYFIIVIYCLNIITDIKQIYTIISYFLVSVIVMLSIGFLQGINLDIFSSSYISRIIFPSNMWNNIIEFKMNFRKGTIYTTLYNPNYMGVYLIIIIPIVIAIMVTAKKKFSKIGFFLLLIISIFNLVKSDSAAGIITLILSFITLIIFALNNLIKNKKVFYSILLMGIFSLLIIGYLNSNKINNIFMNGVKVSNLKQIDTRDELIITYLDTTIKLDYKIDNDRYIFAFTDINNNSIDYTYNADEVYYSLKLDGFESVRIEPVLYNEYYSCLITIDNVEWCFTNQYDDGTFYYINQYGKLVKLIDADNFIDKKYDNLATGRGYIWSRTIPTLSKYMIIGNGADSYVFTFPHNDYVGAGNNGFLGQIINKPHSLYLQIGTHSGMLSLVLYIVFFLIYIFESCKLYWKCTINKKDNIIGLSLFASVISYLFISLANDSSITVTPIFWCIVGMSLSMNRFNMKHIND